MSGVCLRKSEFEAIRHLSAPRAKRELSQTPAPGDSYNRGQSIDSSKCAADPGLTNTEPSVLTKKTSQKETITVHSFGCKKCKRSVALQGDVIDHVPGERESSFECTSIFVEPHSWMQTVEEGASEGKLWCRHCEEQLGCFNWSGIECSCGSWIKPASPLDKKQYNIPFGFEEEREWTTNILCFSLSRS
ncbi:hypothetical protein QVD17_01361 [Tagetes erecta]|uniref:protein-tyrosine-phosphatase n=1 Tax=Tagetes erecta TaxID=13708 RepID=A0AAD8LDC5_TARER|nr:hypothetical protein QVD17_01361 [Tagetes erecta]